MIPVGMAITFAGYSLGMLGYCWLRGYNVTFMNLWGLTWPAKAAASKSAGATAGTVV
jgi:hypothetical protein